MHWVDNLQGILVNEAAEHFECAKIDKPEFRKYVENLTTVYDWDEDFIETAYSMYLQKVNIGGVELTLKMRR
jgi:hypothetical protein